VSDDSDQHLAHPYRDLADLSAAAKKSTKTIPLELMTRARALLRRTIDTGYIASLDRTHAADFIDTLMELTDIASDAIALVKRGSTAAAIATLTAALGVMKWLPDHWGHVIGSLLGLAAGEALMLAVAARAQNVVEQLRQLCEEARVEIRKLPVPERVRVAAEDRQRSESAEEELPSGGTTSKRSRS
jgi:hypothetical protein